MNYTSTNRYIHLGTSKFSKDSFNPIKNEHTFVNKPNGGLWACKYKDDAYTQIWEDYVMHRQLKGHVETLQDGIIFSIDQSAKELIIDTGDDIINFLEKYIVVCKDIKNYFGFVHDSRQIDWEAVAKDYDVIEFTDIGKFLYDDVFKGEFGILSVPCILIMNPDIVTNIEEYHIEHDDAWKKTWKNKLYDQYIRLHSFEESCYLSEDHTDKILKEFVKDRYKEPFDMHPLDKINTYDAFCIYKEFCDSIQEEMFDEDYYCYYGNGEEFFIRSSEEEYDEEEYYEDDYEEEYNEYADYEYDDSQNDMEESDDEEYLGPYAEYYEDEYYL